jgi:hypothetical protein
LKYQAELFKSRHHSQATTTRGSFFLSILLLCLLACAQEPVPTRETVAPTIVPKEASLLAPLGSGAGSQVRGLLSLLPRQASLVALVDAARVLQGPLAESLGGETLRLLRARPELADLEKETGFSLQRDLRSVMLALAALDKEPAAVLIVVEATFSEEKLRAYLKKKALPEENGLFVMPQETALAMVSPGRLLLGDKSFVRAALSRTTAEISVLETALENIDPARPISLAVQIDQGARLRLALPPEFDSLRWASGWLDLSNAAEGMLLLSFSSDAEAEKVAADLARPVDSKDKEEEAFWAWPKTSREGSTVRVEVRIPSTLLLTQLQGWLQLPSAPTSQP